MLRFALILASGVAAVIAPPTYATETSSTDPGVQRAEYTGAGLQSGVLYAGVTVADQQLAAATLQAPASGQVVTVKVADAGGRPVLYDLMQRDAAGAEKVLGSYCSASPQNARLFRASAPLLVRVYAGRCASGELSAPSRGAITATFR